MSRIIVISSPEKVSAEHQKIKALFEAGLKQFHIRKPDFSDFDMISYLQEIPKQYHPYLVLHSHYYLAEEFGLKGIQVGAKRMKEAQAYRHKFEYFGYSAHSFEEIESYKNDYTHFFLSPIYDSISKEGYKANLKTEAIANFLSQHKDVKVIALGGIDTANAASTLSLGFDALAVLGSIWGSTSQANDSVKAYQELNGTLDQRPVVLSIAGFDPSSGAGITADIKTFEQHKTVGLGVSTAITYQNEAEFLGLDWLSIEQIEQQIEVLFKKHQPKFIKVGLIESFDVLERLYKYLKSFNKDVKLIWDPILKASAGFSFHNAEGIQEQYQSLLSDLYLITPNIPECQMLFGTTKPEQIQTQIQEGQLGNVLLKGGHAEGDKVTDILITKDAILPIEGERIANNTKHGTGCILSSAIAANLSKGLTLELAIRNAKNYVSKLIASNQTLLAYHNI